MAKGVIQSLQETFIRAGYKTGILSPIVTDFESYERAVNQGDPNHVRMQSSGEKSAPPTTSGFTLKLQEAFIHAGYKMGILPAIVTDYDSYVRAVNEGDPNRVRMRSPEPKDSSL